MKSSYGITGDIASGKTTLSHYLRRLGFTVIDADVIAREVMQPGQEGFLRVKEAFPQAFIGDVYQRDIMASIIFRDKEKRKELDQLLHPVIIRLMFQRAGEGIAFHDAPLLFESGMDKHLKKVIYVSVDPKIQLQRLMERDGLSRAEAQRRMAAFDFPREEKLKRSYVIENNGSHEQLYAKVNEFLKKEGLL